MIQATSILSSPSPSSSIERLALELTPVIDDLKAICEQHPVTPQLALSATESLLRLRHAFIDNDHPRETKDSFRQHNGLQLLLVLIAKVADLYDPELPKDDKKNLLALHKDALGVLAESLKEHFGNKRDFAKKTPGEGTAALEESLTVLARKLGSAEAETHQFYGGILAAALCEETVASLFTTLAVKFQQREDSLSPDDVRQAVDQGMGTSETVEVTEFLGPFLRIWLMQSSSVAGHKIQRLAVPACLWQLALQSERNVIALHATGMLTSILPLLFNNEYPGDEKFLYQGLARSLCAQGLNNLNDAVALYRNAHTNPDILRFLVDVLKQSKQPPFIHFDLSLHGYCSVEFSSLGRPFPPTTSGGYTLSVWTRFDQFDTSTHTTVFGAFDASQTCFLLVYLEKDTRHLILQTSIRGPRPSVRFKSMVFEPNRWYHIALVHKKPRPPSSSRASLFIDGEFVEQLKIEYPNAPVPSAPNRLPRVQAFFGTPQDLAMRLGRGLSTSRWSLAGAILLDDAYSDDMISVFYNLGPRYYGNFQDCLGSFQTYAASAALNLRNEHLHPGKEELSDIVTAIRRKASALVRESSVLINVSPVSVLDDDGSDNVNGSQHLRFLSRQAAKNLQQLTRNGGNAITVNGAMPAINDSLTRAHGTGILTGDPVVAVPQTLDDASWRIGGCAAVHLSLVQATSTADSLFLAVEALYESVQDNWRNSEAMERENGYGILAALLREKVSCPSGGYNAASKALAVCSSEEECSTLTFNLLLLTLRFVGYDFQQPNRSIIINPLAYRVLLVDLDIWRFGELRVLELYYSQFCLFATEGNFRRFNAKRLSRMRKLPTCLPDILLLLIVNRCHEEAAGSPEGRRIYSGRFASVHSGIQILDGKLHDCGLAPFPSSFYHLCYAQTKAAQQVTEKEKRSVQHIPEAIHIVY